MINTYVVVIYLFLKDLNTCVFVERSSHKKCHTACYFQAFCSTLAHFFYLSDAMKSALSESRKRLVEDIDLDSLLDTSLEKGFLTSVEVRYIKVHISTCSLQDQV